MKKLMQSFNDLKLRNKFLIVYFLSVFLPIVVSNTVFYSITTERFLEQKQTDVDLVVDQTKEEFTRLIDQAIGMATTLYLDVRLYNFFDTEYESAIDYVEAYNYVLRQLGTSMPLYNSIQELNFYTDNPTVIYTGGVHPVTNETLNTEWYNETKGTDRPYLYRETSEQSHINLSLFKELDYYHLFHDFEKFIRIDINNVAIEQVFDNVTLQGDLFLLDGHGHIVYSSHDSIEWESDLISFDQAELPDQYMSSSQTIEDDYLDQWEIVGVVDSSTFTDELMESTWYLFILGLINFILPTFIIVFISKSIHSRIDKVLNHVKNIEKQHFEEYPYVKSKDEIGQLTRQINRMTRKINQLFNEVFISNLEKKDLEIREKQAQLSALQSQINPHFLFNSLETIRMRSLIKGETETANIIENMAGIFRNAITWGREWVTIQDELTLIHAFLEIQVYRFGDKLTFDVDVDDSIYDSKIPNLSILPFVENASIHGIEPLKDQGKITIRIKEENDVITFMIQDNGLGIPEDRLETILKQLDNPEDMGENVGVQNVYYRLKLYYKDNFSFNIETEPERGTRITIQLPKN
ncbi:two-component system, sensor histidine kinase YesM [Pelagirhabdus alkalitolerans]|uniref:histidine kinase n=1 Tax=Pelagirhabdus alkalitolerans TaxID=1612202 RepID=A0A1G6JT61_9BACI|nr:sensor histidine kinase [Pelagirhabdus alkalitolerans]SDC21949.1 two-component system, sensor histidine kinase YesM [Pelagirhabdus alkalitolerans]